MANLPEDTEDVQHVETHRSQDEDLPKANSFAEYVRTALSAGTWTLNLLIALRVFEII